MRVLFGLVVTILLLRPDFRTHGIIMKAFLSRMLLVVGTSLALTLFVSATENQPRAGVDQHNPQNTGREGATLRAAATHPELENRTVMLPGGVPMLIKEVPAGRFRMGSPTDEMDRDADEGPLHEVTITHAFFLGIYEVTQRQWTAVMGDNPSVFKPGLDFPVEQVSWNDSQRFIAKLNSQGVGLFRLPTEAEWEYACRAGTETRFYWRDDRDGSEAPRYAWFGVTENVTTHQVGRLLPNPWGFYDMSGNVFEWCQDFYDQRSYGPEPQIDPHGPLHGTSRAERGGDYRHNLGFCRSANRTPLGSPDARWSGLDSG